MVARKEKDNYANFQVEWMQVLRKVFHECLNSEGTSDRHPAAVIWKKLIEGMPIKVTSKSMNAVGMSIARSVFTCCQERVMSLKEGNTLLCDWEQISVDNLREDIDETSLFRLGGYALHSAIKKYEKQEMTARKELDVLHAIKLPWSNKDELPVNISYLDKGGMSFMKRELLGYLTKVIAKL